MAQDRVTSAVVEALDNGSGNLRATSAVSEALVATSAVPRVTSTTGEVLLATGSPTARVSSAIVEVLVALTVVGGNITVMA